MIERLRIFLKHLGLSVANFEREIGVSKELLSKAINRNSDLKSSTLEKIIERYPELNIYWLLLGEGEMLKKNKVVEDPQAAYGMEGLNIKEVKADALINYLEKQLKEKEKRIEALNMEIGRLREKIPGLPTEHKSYKKSTQ